MSPFDLCEPASVAEALALLDPDDEAVRPLAGGTALMLMMKAGVFRPTRLVSLRRIEPRHFEIERDGDELRIGAMASLASLERSATLGTALPVVARTLPTLSNVRVRNVATLGGHLAHGDPHMDLPPVLMALGARVVAAGRSGARTIALDDFYRGYYETALARDELIAEVRVPLIDARRAAYLKITTRSADDWPALGIAVALDLGADGTVAAARVAVSAATERPLRVPEAEALLAGARVDDARLASAGEAAAAAVEPVADASGSAAFKRNLLRVGLGRAVRKALAPDPMPTAMTTP